jgi:hypothetical protein
VVTWTVSDLEPSEFKGLAVTLKAPEEVGAVRLESEVSTTTTAGDVITDSATRSLSVTGTAVLDLQLSLKPKDQLLPGDVLDMDFGFQNIGNAAALDGRVGDKRRRSIPRCWLGLTMRAVVRMTVLKAT